MLENFDKQNYKFGYTVKEEEEEDVERDYFRPRRPGAGAREVKPRTLLHEDFKSEVGEVKEILVEEEMEQGYIFRIYTIRGPLKRG